ncbi:MAG: ATP synthase F0 subunit B [Desulfovibrio sp.]|jgi:F-type H+-transporting ATPase subunit b|nr:ATP synthase F0 subunit B [Desulfovibrio sp.]
MEIIFILFSALQNASHGVKVLEHIPHEMRGRPASMDNMISIDHTIFIQLINFLIAIVGLHFLLIKPVRDRIASRKTFTDAISGEIEHFTAKASEKIAGYEAALSEAKAKAGLTREAIKSQAASREQEIIRAAHAAAHAYLENARNEYARVCKTARESLLNEINTFAAQSMKKILD